MRLKSRLKFVPKGFQLLLPEIGMKKALNGSFNQMADAFANIVAKNPALAQKQGWPTNRVDQENWLDERECKRMIANGWTQFVDFESESPPLIQAGGVSRSRPSAGVVAAGSKALTGASIYAEMFRGSKPVSKEVAERRAEICVTCPLNLRVGFKEWFVEKVANGIMELVALMNRQNLTTSKDKELGTCAACSCPLSVKIHVASEVIQRHTEPDVIARFDHRCWILSEIKGEGAQQQSASPVG